MADDLSFTRTAAIRFVSMLGDAVDVTLVDFDAAVRVARYARRDHPRLVERIRSQPLGRFTALYDAIGVYLDGAAEQMGRTVMLLYTDGGDTRSALRLPELLDLLRASSATVFVIGAPQRPGGSRWDERASLQAIAAATGGEAFFPASPKELDRCTRGCWRPFARSTRWATSRPTSGATARGGRWSSGSRGRGWTPYASMRVAATSRRSDGERQPGRRPTPNLERAQAPSPGPPASGTMADSHALAVRPLHSRLRVRAGGRSGTRDPGAHRGPGARRPAPGAARRHRVGQDVHDGAHHRDGEPAHAGDGPQQDAGRAAVPGVPAVLPGERGRVLRELLRLLPARGVRPGDRLVHREGSDDQRRNRPDEAVRHAVALRAAGRHHRGERVVHLRPGVAGGVLRHAAAARARPADRPRSGAAEAGRNPVRAQRPRVRPRHVQGAGGHRRGLPVVRGARPPHRAVRRRSGRPRVVRRADGPDVAPARQDRDLPEVALRGAARAHATRRRVDQGRARVVPNRSSSRRAGCSRRSGCTSGRCSTSR